MDRATLRQVLAKHFTKDELRTLYFDLDVDYEALPDQGKDAKIRELIAHFANRERTAELLDGIRQARPGVIESYSLPDVPGLALSEKHLESQRDTLPQAPPPREMEQARPIDDFISKLLVVLDAKSEWFWFVVFLAFIVIVVFTIQTTLNVVVRPSSSTSMPSVIVSNKSGDEIVEFIIREELFGIGVQLVMIIVLTCIVGAPISFVFTWLYFIRVIAEKRISDETISAAGIITILNIEDSEQIIETKDLVLGRYQSELPDKDIWLIVWSELELVWYPMNGPAEKHKGVWQHKLGFLRNGPYKLFIVLTDVRSSEKLKSFVERGERFSHPMKDIGLKLEIIKAIHIQVQIDET
ncbi:MAG: hypothetical protein GY832_17045 [Chloroflexi bacterium]|nr:hypothetical protein [Chloroflexota bacterium]